MKAKKIIERIIKVVNVMLNVFMVFIAIVSFGHFGTNGYMYSDDIYRAIWMVLMFGIINMADQIIRKIIRDF